MTTRRRERPILFTAPMVHAILAGLKTQTRRIVRPQPEPFGTSSYGGTRQGWIWQRSKNWARSWNDDDKSPYGRVDATFAMGIEGPYGRRGDRLWVRETFYQECGGYTSPSGEWISTWNPYIEYLDQRSKSGWRWPDEQRGWMAKRPSIFLPRRASRIVLEVTEIRVQRLQQISEEDAKAEGVTFDGTWWSGAPHEIKGTPKCFPSAVRAYESLWDSINGKAKGKKKAAPWSSNPWVWAITFRRPEEKETR